MKWPVLGRFTSCSAKLALALLGVACASCSGCGQTSSAGAGRQVPGEPVETQEPNTKSFKPAAAGQTRAPFTPANVAFEVKTLAKGLERPWSLAFLPDGSKLITEKPGRLRLLSNDGALSAPLAGVPAVDDEGQGGCSTWCSAPPSPPMAPCSSRSPSRATAATERPSRELASYWELPRGSTTSR